MCRTGQIRSSVAGLSKRSMAANRPLMATKMPRAPAGYARALVRRPGPASARGAHRRTAPLQNQPKRPSAPWKRPSGRPGQNRPRTRPPGRVARQNRPRTCPPAPRGSDCLPGWRLRPPRNSAPLPTADLSLYGHRHIRLRWTMPSRRIRQRLGSDPSAADSVTSLPVGRPGLG